MSHYADWRQSLGPGRLRREAAGWSLAALTVAATATAAATAAFRVEELGHRDALQEALYLDLEPVPPAPAALAAPEAAPEVPQVEAPVAPEPEEIAEPEPELAPPPPDVRPPAETVDLPDIPVPTSETFAYDPPPPPPPEEEEVAEIPPDARPMPRPERTPPPEKKPDPPKREVKKAAAPPPQQAAAPTRSTGSAAAVASRGQVQNLTAKWGAEIRKRIQRHTRGARGQAGEVTVRLTVSQGGALGGASVVRSSGNPRIDQLALRAVQSAGRFPAAPAALTDPQYTFTLPITFAR
ncbi:energy transducer TonB [Cereibacter sphaeroides]|uniref:Energy transducer TonB n=1 Tax=Cereibacter sphaeroides TaxID=1063 RepID=A0AAX1UGV4_CERSP|nr:TonB family protein [Cereibacter sphaeroides]RHZ91650.1 energy transducer TonB [Cereibacter sphaeroides]SNS58966.1 outer membrane transport energization protein TonB [[Luteovulum] sphaeroides subsp. megalophilum]